MRNDERWYRRFAEVPGLRYEGDLRLRSRLRARDAVPEVSRFDFDGQSSVSLMWPMIGGGSTGASPAHELAFGGWDDPSDKIRERILSALELPGILSDYHFAIQSASEALWRRRREEPGQLAFVEWLCWWDVALIEAHPYVIEFEQDGKKRYFAVHAFDRIVGLYEREGFLHEALAAAERFAPFRPNIDTVSELRARVAKLREEHA